MSYDLCLVEVITEGCVSPAPVADGSLIVLPVEASAAHPTKFSREPTLWFTSTPFHLTFLSWECSSCSRLEIDLC